MADAPRLARSFRIGHHLVEPSLMRIVGPAGPTHVEPRVMEVLVALAERAPEPVSRDALIDAVWGHAFVTDGVVTRCISRLRRLLDDDRGQPRVIETLAKRGYRLLEPVKFVDPASPIAAASTRTTAITVLPFLNLSGNAADDYVADGLTELLIANLAGVSSLRVTSRTSSMTHKATRKRIADIAAELGVTHVVEGSVLHSEARLQVVVQLIDASSDVHVFSRTYTREITGLLSLLNEIAWTVAHEVRTTLTPAEASRLAAPVTISEDALHAYLRGRYLQAQRTADALRKADEAFGECARLEPAFAPAFAGQAGCHIMLAIYGAVRPSEAGRLARAHSERACALDPDSGEAHAARGSVRLFFDWDFAAARTCYERALALKPSHSGTYLSYGDLKVALGDHDGGMALLQQAVRLDPFNLGYNMNVGDFLFMAARYEEAAAQQRRVLEMAPHFVISRARLAENLAMLGRADEARRESDQAFAEAPGQPRVRESRAFVLAATGAQDEARAQLAALATESSSRYVNPWELARAYAVMDDRERAFAWLEAAFDDRSPVMIFCGIYPAFRGLHADARYAALLQRLGLPGDMAPSTTMQASGLTATAKPGRRLLGFLLVATLLGCAQPPIEPRATPPSAAPTAPPPPIEQTPAPAIEQAPAPLADTASRATERGRISHYGDDFAGKETASGEIFDPEKLTMAHRTLPFGTRVRVTNVENDRSVEVVVNDRGPFVAGRIADVSKAAARRLGMIGDGVVPATLQVLSSAAAR